MPWSDIPDCLGGTYGEAHLSCLPAVFKNLIEASLILAAITAVIFILIGAYRLVTSAGDEEAVKKARKTLTLAIVGLLIIFTSFFVVNFIGGLTGTTNCITQMGLSHCQ